MRQEQVGTNARLDGAIHEQVGTNARLDRLEKRTQQNTAAISELRVSVIRMADKLNELIDLGKRVRRLEDKVFS